MLLQLVELDQESQPGVNIRLTTKATVLASQTATKTQHDASGRPAAETDFYVERVGGSTIGEPLLLLHQALQQTACRSLLHCRACLEAFTLPICPSNVKHAFSSQTNAAA